MRRAAHGQLEAGQHHLFRAVPHGAVALAPARQSFPVTALKPPFQYFGGKTMLAARIVNVLPAHAHYVEPFAGSLAVLLAKPYSPMETVNDIDGELMTFWRVLRERPDEMIRACALTPHGRAEFDAAYDRPDGLDELETARRVWVRLSQGRGGTLRRTGWRQYLKAAGTTSMPAYLDGYLDRMAPVVERLHHVSLECRPALDIVKRYGAHDNVLLYVDPPYLGAARAPGDDSYRSGTKRYQHEMMGADEHAELLEALCGCAAAVVLSGYWSQLYADRLAGWRAVRWDVGTGQSARGEWSVRTEVAWLNR